jgi:hypothetical protein
MSVHCAKSSSVNFFKSEKEELDPVFARIQNMAVLKAGLIKQVRLSKSPVLVNVTNSHLATAF